MTATRHGRQLTTRLKLSPRAKSTNEMRLRREFGIINGYARTVPAIR